MEIPNAEEIQNMSDEDVAEMNNQLAKKAVKNFLTIQMVKWGLILGVSYGARKWAQRKAKEA